MENEGVGRLFNQCLTLLEEFMAHTKEQHGILTSEEMDAEALNESLNRRKVALDGLNETYNAIEAAGGLEAEQRDCIAALLAEIQKLDNQNLALADQRARELKNQARQASQSRKAVTGYGKTDIAGGPTSEMFDKKS